MITSLQEFCCGQIHDHVDLHVNLKPCNQLRAQAMRFAAKGRIHAKATDEYYPELLHVVASLYNELGYTKASQLTLSELRLLFPENRWSH